MTGLFIASIIGNAVLLVVCIMEVRLRLRTDQMRRLEVSREREDKSLAEAELTRIYIDYTNFAESIAASLEIIRKDIDRNYMHTHEGHVLDMLAWELKRNCESGYPRHEIRVNNIMEKIDESKGREFVSAEHTMNLGQLLAFAWKLHADARKHAGEIEKVISESCGHTDQAAWLSKVLAMYERLCDYRKDVAVQRLRAVLDSWERGQSDPWDLACMLK